MADIDVVAYLSSKGLHGRQSGGDEVAYPCCFECNESPDSTKRKLYVNTELGLYTCFVCGASGGTYLLQKHFGDDPAKPEPGTDPFTRRRILDWAAELGATWLSNNDKAMLYLLNDRGLSPETIADAKFGLVVPPWSLVGNLPEDFTKKELLNTGLVYRDGPRANQDFFYSHLLIPYITRGHVAQIRGRQWESDKGGKYLTGPGDPSLFYGVDDLEFAEDVIIVEGEFDRAVLKQHLAASNDERARKIAVVGLAGTNGMPDGAERYFAATKRIYFGLDPDDPGRRAALKYKEQFGTRARILELPPELPKCDWTEYLLPVPPTADESWHRRHPHAGHTWHDVIALLGTAAGKRVFTVGEAEYAWKRQKEVGEGFKTGYQGLDAAILPGLLPGQLVIVLAKTGVGKTVFLCNLAYNMRDKRVLFISLEMTREEVYERLRRIFHFHNPRATDAEIREAYRNVLICDENRLGEKDFEQIVSEYEVETGFRPEVVFVDYLGYYARGQRGNSNYEKTTNAAMQLKAEAKGGTTQAPDKRFVVIAPAQVNRGALSGKPITLDDARDSGAIEETADFLMSLWRPDEALTSDAATVNVQPSGKVKLTLLKSRHGNQGRTLTLAMDLLALVVVDDLTPAAKRCADHNYLHWRGVTYDELRAQETAPIQAALRLKGNDR